MDWNDGTFILSCLKGRFLLDIGILSAMWPRQCSRTTSEENLASPKKHFTSSFWARNFLSKHSNLCKFLYPALDWELDEETLCAFPILIKLWIASLKIANEKNTCSVRNPLFFNINKFLFIKNLGVSFSSHHIFYLRQDSAFRKFRIRSKDPRSVELKGIFHDKSYNLYSGSRLPGFFLW